MAHLKQGSLLRKAKSFKAVEPKKHRHEPSCEYPHKAFPFLEC